MNTFKHQNDVLTVLLHDTDVQNIRYKTTYYNLLLQLTTNYYFPTTKNYTHAHTHLCLKCFLSLIRTHTHSRTKTEKNPFTTIYIQYFLGHPAAATVLPVS